MENTKLVLGRSISSWMEEHPLLVDMIETKEVLWENECLQAFVEGDITYDHITEAAERLNRFAPLLKEAFPETMKNDGIIESFLIPVENMKNKITEEYSPIVGKVYLKGDHDLPIAGSVKARGGIYEVLKLAENLAMDNGLSVSDDYSVLLTKRYKELFSTYSISVGSTGNLGLSIGIISAKLGFNVTVHMSHDAKQWKKDLLRDNGVQVVEHASDYSKAVELGRVACQKDHKCFFIDDENSIDLFLGYSVAAMRLKKQLTEKNILVDEDHPLFVYLPCGVGGAPGGIAYGLKMFLGNHVHVFFAEPTHSPCMLLGLMTKQYEKISVQDFGIDNLTDADGLAVGRPSSFVGKTVGPFLTGIFTVQDEQLYKLLFLLSQTEQINLEPSALAGMYGPILLNRSNWYDANFSREQLQNSTHIVWATGGSLVPNKMMIQYIEQGKSIFSNQ
ncbi:D-serine ammonia-lyase [Cytobacillus sp. FJAT-54145]|uniref:Probable D-serine dehydratase n=1 Tax=Cytobacillus spartinae TaxID=3299023 RepID=A0ABW6K5K5_9BACI